MRRLLFWIRGITAQQIHAATEVWLVVCFMMDTKPGRMIAMLAKSRGCILFGFCFLLFTGASWAQFTAISGDVKGPDGQKLRGAEILIEREGQKGTYKGAKTDKNGHYIYNGLPIGKYTVSVLVDGEKRDQISGVTTKLGDPIELNFDL